jgi:hypothetical protein
MTIAQREQRMSLTVVVLDNATMHHHIDANKLNEWLVEHRLLCCIYRLTVPNSASSEPFGSVQKYH